MSVLADGHRAVCSYCHSQRVVEGANAGVDGILPSAESTGIACSCGGTLHKAYDRELPLLMCSDCGGLLVAKDVLRELVELRRSAYTGADRMPGEPGEEPDRGRPCPLCCHTMEVHPYYGPGRVVVDDCEACRVLWLDAGELTRIEQAPGSRKPIAPVMKHEQLFDTSGPPAYDHSDALLGAASLMGRIALGVARHC